MTYIKWKDEVEGYLVNLPQEEKQKIFSYFSEMYADKRDAGKSEEQIIEEFGAPYDVAQRILADSRDAANQQDGQKGGQTDGAANVSGGNNYNYNYYNYNYGAAPQENNASAEYAPPPATAEEQKDPFRDGLRIANTGGGEKAQKKQTNVARLIVSIILTIVLVGLTVSLIGAALALVLEGFVSIGFAVGGLVSYECGGAEGAQMIGLGLIVSGVGIALLAPFSALCSFLWRKLKEFMKGV